MKAVVQLISAAGIFGTAAMVFVGLLVGIMTVGETLRTTGGEPLHAAIFLGAVVVAVLIFVGNGG